MPRYKLIIEYDGTDFSGWQRQPDARTVEGELEQAFSKILQQPIDLIGQGRTDAGVHARGQAAHVDLPDDIKGLESLKSGVNGLVGREIYIHEMVQVSDSFHARFDAGSREYSYTIFKEFSPLHRRNSWHLPKGCDSRILYQCASLLKGEFDFAGFSKFNEENYSTLCTILKSELIENHQAFVYVIRANRFLRNMVRRIVGTMVKAGEGKISVQDFKELLRNPEVGIQTFTAPAQGLVLERVDYEINL